MSLAELRSELKSLRKSANPVPASRMKKADIAMEIARLKGVAPPTTPEKPKAEEPKAAPKAPSKAEKPKAEKPKAAPKSKSAAEVVVPTTDSAKPSKGSEEMKARMAKLREMRKAKKEA
jgi:hypothetical protein